MTIKQTENSLVEILIIIARIFGDSFTNVLKNACNKNYGSCVLR